MCPQNTAAGLLVSRLGRHQSSKVSDLPSSRRHKHNNKKLRSCPTYLSLKFSTFFHILDSNLFLRLHCFGKQDFTVLLTKKTFFFLKRKSFEIETHLIFSFPIATSCQVHLYSVESIWNRVPSLFTFHFHFL